MAPIATDDIPTIEKAEVGHAGKASIPTISLAPLLDPSTTAQARQECAHALLLAFQTYGFLYLTSYDTLIPPTLLSKVYAQSAHFFRLPQSTKDGVDWTTPSANRGYTGMGREKVSYNLKKEDVQNIRETEGEDLKESFEIGREGEQGMPNRWYTDRPEDGVNGAEEFKETMMDFWERCKTVHQILMRGIAIGLDVSLGEGKGEGGGIINETFFDQYTKTGDNTLRLLHYPPVPRGGFENGKRVRAGAHTDYGSITLLFQDSRGGLQVEPPSASTSTSVGGVMRGTTGKGGWIDVEPRESTMVVNAGDLLSRWSNDLIRSTMHRVVEPPLPPPSSLPQHSSSMSEEKGEKGEYPARYSIAYFCNPDYDGWIEALPGTWNQEDGQGNGNGKKYEGINSGDYLVQRLTATHDL